MEVEMKFGAREISLCKAAMMAVAALALMVVGPASLALASGPFVVDLFSKEKACCGNTIFVDNAQGKVIEVDMEGNVVWDYKVPGAGFGSSVKRRMKMGSPGSAPVPGRHRGMSGVLTDVELLPGGNILVTVGGRGVYEVNRAGEVVWKYLNSNVSHDADRLANGNTLMACANAETVSPFPYKDPQVIEVDPKGNQVWAWHAKEHYLESRYRDIRSRDWNDWTHVNSVTRLPDGNTMISVRNWGLIIAVDKAGSTVWDAGGEGVFHEPHNPHLLPSGNILVCESIKGTVLEFDRNSRRVVWKYPVVGWREGGEYLFIRGVERLPNGNNLIVDSGGSIIEVTPQKEVVWRLRKKQYKVRLRPFRPWEMRSTSFFKADRVGGGYHGGR
jgi:outer membrane protein assembly factor BamB